MYPEDFYCFLYLPQNSNSFIFGIYSSHLESNVNSFLSVDSQMDECISIMYKMMTAMQEKSILPV